MRIIAGVARGMTLVAPRGKNTRPTSDRVRSAIFSILGERVVGATVADLFAGSGGLGLEAASRGARRVVFVENDKRALVALERNVAEFRRRAPVGLEIFREDVFRFLRRGERFDVVLADPPYGETAQRLVTMPVATEWLVLESAMHDPCMPAPVWRVERDAVYGDTRVLVLRCCARKCEPPSDSK
ncbi:MAG: RsmD family RNA methyltransferase [Verrucomicrobiae bacterium]|nr:RsmD family RNA methyltransferase [Verrucomicrobiae bacterium]MDW8343514.1 RsmD family RNA methyltransferase [Verrucomicrobiae bacterium]